MSEAVTPEIDLDPEDWDAFARTAHRAVDDVVRFLSTVRDRAPWRPMAEEAKADLDEPVPHTAQELAAVYEQFQRSVLPYPTGNVHPRFWGWVMGTGTADGVLAELLAAAMNNHVAGYDQSASVLEHKVLAWLKELMGYPASATGLLVSGATAANLTGLAVARRAMAGFDVREEGLGNAPRLLVYGSEETHGWAARCCDLLGLGRRAFQRVPCDREGRIDLAAASLRIREDRAAGNRPIAVIGNAGTVNTGAFDDLDALADLCARERLWFHVDGAFGALAAWSPRLRPLVHGLERADSLAFDLHKWGYLPYEVGCVLVRDNEAQRATFTLAADYLRPPGRGIQPEVLELSELGLQLSRGFRALKVWMALKTHGVARLARLIEQNVDQARYLAGRIEAEPRLELVAPVPLNVVCFRYVGIDLPSGALDAWNQEILLRCQEEGIAVPSSTLVDGRFAIRLAITNHRSRRSDFDVFLEGILRLAKRLEDEGETIPVGLDPERDHAETARL